MEQEKGNFKGRVFGGFNRRDVINYIEQLASERNSLKRENEELRERLDELEYGENQEREEAEDSRQAIQLALAQARGVLDGIRGEYKALCADIKINATQASHELEQVAARLTGLQESLERAGQRLETIADSLKEDSGDSGEDL